jgi:gas vesicle protein
MTKERKAVSGIWYLLGGFAAGTAAGILLAPKSGLDTRSDIGEWGRRGRERAQGLISRISEKIPMRVKAGAAVGAVRGGVKSAAREVSERVEGKMGEFGS